MNITFEDRDYQYDPAAIDVKTAIKIREHTGCGILSWERACDDADPIALQALLWAIKQQNGENVSIRSLNFSIVEFHRALVDAAIAEIARQARAGDDVDPTVTAGE